MATAVTLRTTDVTAHVLPRSLRLGPHDLFAHVRVAAFRLKSTSPVEPTEDDFVKVSKTDGTGAAFAGLAKMPDTRNRPVVPIEYDVVCQGWEALLDRVNITTGMNLDANTVDVVLVKAALDTFYAQVSSTASHKLYPASAALPYKRVPAGVWTFRNLMDWITSQTGAPWWIDPATKAFHYNDFEQAAPFVLSDKAGTGKSECLSLDRHRDAVGRAVRVSVSDGNGNVTTCTDWDAYAEVQTKMADEPGSPSARFTQLPDIVDSALDTEDKRKRAGFYALEVAAGRTVLVATVADEGLAIGQQADVISSRYGTGTSPHPHLEQWELGVTSTTEDLDTGMGRFMVTKVTPREIGKDRWLWDVELGDPNEVVSALLGRGDAR